jgi:uncharacterized iron-regulated protein
MIKKIFLLFFSALLIALLVNRVRNRDVLRVNDNMYVTFNEMVRDVAKTDIIFMGEVHNVQEHHAIELALIRKFHESDIPIVVGLEMFRSDSQEELDSWVMGTSSLDQFLRIYYDNWRQPWLSYRDIFLYVREHQIPAIGLNIPDDIGLAIARKGFASLSSEQKKILPPGISCDVDPTYMRFIRSAYAGHAGGGTRTFLNFCEAQMVWDKTMARGIIETIKKNPGKKVLVLCGIGHAWKRGIPEQVAKLSKYTAKVIVPLIPGQIDPKTVSTGDADYVVLR